MGNEWDEYAGSWDDDPAARAYAAAAFGSLSELLGASALQEATVLDFGCGTGLLTEYLVTGGATIEAVDTSNAMLDVLDAKIDRYGWSAVHTSSDPPEVVDGFDLVVCSSVCSFLADYPSAVGELASRLAPGGLFVQWDWERSGDDGHGLTPDQIRAALTAAGLTAIDVRPGFAIEVNDQIMSPLMGHGRRPPQ